MYFETLFSSGKNGPGSGGATSSGDLGINKGRPQSGKGAGPSNTGPKVKVSTLDISIANFK